MSFSQHPVQGNSGPAHEVVEAYLNGLGKKDFSGVPFDADFTYESPLLPTLVGQPRLIGQAAIEFLQGLFPAIEGVRIKQHTFDLLTIHGVIPIFDRFHVVDGRLKLANPFYDPSPILNAAK
jgi:hypothetical protein